ncbi:MAG: putative RND superfamily exporter protein [Gammaproteobacteria bacterium]|jgi:predicted RND superfamily exporter protein
MDNFEATFARWVIRNRIAIIVLSIVAIGVLAMGASKLRFDTSYRAFFSDDNPQLIAFENLENTYVKDDNVMMIVAPRDQNIFTRDHLQAIEEITAASWQVPFSNRVDSISNFQYTEAEDDDLVVRDMVKDAQSLSDEALAKVRAAILAEPGLVKRLISERGHVTGVNVTVQLSPDQRAEATGVIAAAVAEIVAETQARHPDLDIYLSGMVMLDQAFFESAMDDSTQLVPLSFVLMMGLIALLVGGLFGTFVTFLVIVFSICAAMGIGGHIGFPLTGLSASAPIIILTVAVANCVHLLVTFTHEMHAGSDKLAAMEESLRVNLQPVFLASATTAIGFMSMNFSEVPPFNHLGSLVTFGVLISFILTVSFLPALMTLLPVHVKKSAEDDYRRMDSLAQFVIRKRRPLLWSMSIIAIVCVANLPRNELNDIFLHYFDDSLTFRSDSNFMIENLTGLDFINYSLDSGESGGISDPAFLQDVENFAVWLEAQPEVTHVDRFTNIMKRLNKNMHGDDQAFYSLPKERDLAAQYLLLYEMSLPYGLDLNNQVNVDKSSTKLTATVGVLSSKAMIDFNDRSLAWAEENAPSFVNTDSAGISLMFSYIGQRNIVAMLLGTTIALVLISGILIFALRSLRLGAISLLPNLAPAAIGFGLWGIFVGQVGLSLSIVAGMTFGIVIDDTVHFLSKYLRARRENGLSSEDAVRYAFRTVGRALVVTTLTLVVGFSVLATSKFQMNSGMGLMTSIIITLALVMVFLMLPPLLMKTEENTTYA